MASTEYSSLSTDSKLSDVLNRHPDFLDQLALCLDGNLRLTPNWEQLAEQLNVDEDDIKKLEQYKEQSPTIQLFEYLEVTQPQLTIGQLRSAMKHINRNDVLFLLRRKGGDYMYVKDVITPGSELLQTMADELDREIPGVEDWRHLAYNLDAPVDKLQAFGRLEQKGKSPTKELMLCLVTRFPDTTLKDVVKALAKIQRNDAIQIITRQFPDTVAPQEIRAQGPIAEAAFKEAMEKGSVPVYRGRIMLIGQDRAGKTNPKKFLLGIPFEPEEDSTVGVKVEPTKFEVEIDQVKEWQRCTDKKKLDLSASEDIAKITAENVKALEAKSQEAIDPFKIEEDAEGLAQSDARKDNKAEIDSSFSNVQPNEMPADQDLQLGIDTTASLTIDDIKEKVQQCLQGLELNDDVKAGKEVILSVWDFAGQHLYYASHSVFLSLRAVYVLVYNLSKDLSAQAQPCAKQGTLDIVLENPTNQTNLDNLLSWLVSVHCIQRTGDEASKVLREKGLTYLRPPVFVVGTHADIPFKDIKDMEKHIKESISGKTYTNHVIRPFFAVNNTRSRSDYGVQALKNRISEVLIQEPYMGEKVPIRWFHFEKVIEALVAKKIYHMEVNELLTITKRFCRIDDEVELKTMLNFYHDLGVIVKHGRTVVLQALWLIDLFRQLITVRPFDKMRRANVNRNTLFQPSLDRFL